MIEGYLRFSGLILVAVALSSLLGQLRGLAWLYTWGGAVGMALPTACCFILVGVALFLLADAP